MDNNRAERLLRGAVNLRKTAMEAARLGQDN
ncbi:MAG: hypothetical protein IPI39_25360 [Candidatus Obscuribacter sp.]|nr:hypothetical protein [Candidatus Obscuribacter sp.]